MAALQTIQASTLTAGQQAQINAMSRPSYQGAADVGKVAAAPCGTCAPTPRRGNRLVVPLAQLGLVDTVRTAHAAPGTFTVNFTGVAGLGVSGRGVDSTGLPRDVRIFLVEESAAGSFVRLLSMRGDARAPEPNIPVSGIPRGLMTLDPQNFWNLGARYTGTVITTSFSATYEINAVSTITLAMVSLSSDFLANANEACGIDIAE
jgi:hypothetical protein